MFKKLLTVAVLLTVTSSWASTKYNLDASHGSVGFTVPHLMISKVSGRFDKFEGQFAFDEKTGKVDELNAKIDIDSINTNEPKRDEHIKSDDFFGVRAKDKKLVEAKRWMTFKSTKTDIKDKKPTSITGDLTMNGQTHPVTLNVTYKGTAKDPWGSTKLGFEATGKIKRKEFGLAWNKALETGGVLVGEEVTILIDGEAAAVAPAPAKK